MSNTYRINLTAEQSDKLINLILNKYSVVESIEYLTNFDCFKVIGFWYSGNPSYDPAEYGSKYFYRDKDSKVFNFLYEFMKPGIRNCRIEELGL
jgi:hypothetical protein